jgi:choline-glycine betaine transporter
MGIGIVLIAWAVVGTILATVGAAVTGGAAAFLTRGVQHVRRTAILVATAFPFACLVWGGAVFGVQAVVNETALHRAALQHPSRNHRPISTKGTFLSR